MKQGMSEESVVNSQVAYVTEEQLVERMRLMEIRVMNSCQPLFDELNDARLELVERNMRLQQQMNKIQEAVRTLEERYDHRVAGRGGGTCRAHTNY
jgi:hypothetical protein